MTDSRLSYATITPARNERANLERLAGSMTAQTVRPTAWVIADDGSDDGTAELAAGWAHEHEWIHLARRARVNGQLTEGRREGRDLHAFRDGIQTLDRLPEIVVKVDADTSFKPTYFEQLLERFRDEPDLGIAGGACYELENGQWVRQKVSSTHPRGASRAYRRECLDIVMSMEPKMGWDGLDEAKAAVRGYRSASLLELGFCHHRPVGGREKDRWRHGTAQGKAAWYMGYRPSYLLARTLYRMARDPSAAGMVAGYTAAAAERAPRCDDTDAIHHLRERQRLGSVLRRGSPP